MDGEGSAPPATGRRVEWGAAPVWLREEVETRLGARVAGAVTQVGGFSPGVAARLRLVDGRRAFVKAVGPEPNPASPAAQTPPRPGSRRSASASRTASSAGAAWPPRTPPATTWPAWTRGRPATWTGWPTWMRTHRLDLTAPRRETSGLDEGPAQLLQPGCRPLSALAQAR